MQEILIGANREDRICLQTFKSEHALATNLPFITQRMAAEHSQSRECDIMKHVRLRSDGQPPYAVPPGYAEKEATHAVRPPSVSSGGFVVEG